MIYLDNVATGGFKPDTVINAVNSTIKYLCANPGRSGHKLSLTGAEIVNNCRSVLAEFFSCQPERVIFTKNCTEALNTAIFGLCKKGTHVITTVFEHNSVLRPLYYLEKNKMISLDIIEPKNNLPMETAILNAIKKDTSLIVVTSISNVTGEILPIQKIGEICKKYDIKFILDGAQGGGHIDLDVQKNNISALCLAGHKGLYGIMGSGALILGENTNLSPLLFGGTGTDTFSPFQPEYYPERLEAGTLSLPAIASLLEGVQYIKRNFLPFQKRLLYYTDFLISELTKIPLVKVYSSPNPAGIVAFEIIGKDSNEVATVLDSNYDIAVRGGFHCAPLCHKYLHTEVNGLVRIGASPNNTERELLYVASSIKNIAKT